MIRKEGRGKEKWKRRWGLGCKQREITPKCTTTESRTFSRYCIIYTRMHAENVLQVEHWVTDWHILHTEKYREREGGEGAKRRVQFNAARDSSHHHHESPEIFVCVCACVCELFVILGIKCTRANKLYIQNPDTKPASLATTYRCRLDEWWQKKIFTWNHLLLPLLQRQGEPPLWGKPL